MDWNHLNVMVALAEQGTLKAAAEQLDLNTSTVWRQVQNLEKTLGSQLFIAGKSGYALTDVGRSVLEHARQVSAHIEAIKTQSCAQHASMQGLIRITGPENMVRKLLPPLVNEFRNENPGVEFELIEDAAALNLVRREADLALRITETPPDEVIAKKIGRVQWAVYGHKKLVAGRKFTLQTISELPFVDYHDVPAQGVRWFQNNIKPRLRPVRCNSVSSAAHCAALGMGFVLLPDNENWDLEKVISLPEEAASNFWILAHPEMRNALRISAFRRFLIDKLTAQPVSALM